LQWAIAELERSAEFMKNLLLIISLIFWAAKLIAAPNGMTIHRIQSGEPEVDGWYSASSTNGAFSVRLPIPFNDFTTPAGADSDARCFAIGSKSPEGVSFSAVRLPILKPRNSIHDYLVEFSSKFESEGVLQEKRFIEVGGREALDCTVRSGLSGAFFRIIGLSDGSLIMTVGYPAGIDSDIVHKAALKFFASAEIQKK
jgi:hypothetical protein